MQSIEKHIFNVLAKQQIAYDVFWHTVTSHQITNSHSVEKSLQLDEYDVQLMMPCHFTLVDEDTISVLEFNKYCSYKGLNCSISKVDKDKPEYNIEATENLIENLWSERFADTKHRLCQFYSLEKVYDMIKNTMDINKNISYDGIIAIRADMAPITDIDLPEYLHELQQSDITHMKIWIPDFQDFGGYNDRAAFGSYPSMTHYMTRRHVYMETSYIYKTHSERFLYIYLNQMKIQVINSSYRTVRVRADGCVDRMDTWHMHMNESMMKWLPTCFDENPNSNLNQITVCPRLLPDVC